MAGFVQESRGHEGTFVFNLNAFLKYCKHITIALQEKYRYYHLVIPEPFF